MTEDSFIYLSTKNIWKYMQPHNLIMREEWRIKGGTEKNERREEEEKIRAGKQNERRGRGKRAAKRGQVDENMAGKEKRKRRLNDIKGEE